MSEFKRVLITGASGFLASHIIPVLRQELNAEIYEISRSDYNLSDQQQVKAMFDDIHPDTVIHLAARVGGILANGKYPADFLYENLLINTLVFDACFRSGVKKMLTFICGCSYPAEALSPIGENQLWNGYPQLEGAPYSTAKMMMLVQSAAYRQQHGFNSIVLLPGNAYGEFDNFDRESAHVVPAMIRRFVEARERSSPSVTCYGSGKPTRDFVYAGDVAKLIPWFLINYNSSEPVNISSGTSVSIQQLAESVRNIVGYRGDLRWDTSKPDGQMDKIFDIQRLRSLGLSCDTPLDIGLKKTADWFVKARKEGMVRL